VLLPPPDLDAIVALRLLQEGFQDGAALAAKLRLAFHALPSAALQNPSLSVGVGEHAWGLPQLAPFLRAAGLLKRTSPEVAEARLLMECLVNLVAIQLRAADALAAKTFIRDLFLSAEVAAAFSVFVHARLLFHFQSLACALSAFSHSARVKRLSQHFLVVFSRSPHTDFFVSLSLSLSLLFSLSSLLFSIYL
jgi:hypothetical protein